MSDYMKKFLLAGIGLSKTVVEQAENRVQELVEKGEQAEDRYSKLAKELFDETEKNLIDFKNFLNPFNKKRVEDKDARLDQLSNELAELKKEINELKKTGLG